MSARIGLITAVLLSLAMPLSAHHGWGGQQEQETSLTGVVAQVPSLAGPHATMKIRVDQQVWDLTLSDANRVSAAGLKEDTLKVGDTVTVHGHRSSDPKRFEMKTERVVHNGRTYAVYPNR
jgi:hypothetical protein